MQNHGTYLYFYEINKSILHAWSHVAACQNCINHKITWCNHCGQEQKGKEHFLRRASSSFGQEFSASFWRFWPVWGRFGVKTVAAYEGVVGFAGVIVSMRLVSVQDVRQVMNFTGLYSYIHTDVVVAVLRWAVGDGILVRLHTLWTPRSCVHCISQKVKHVLMRFYKTRIKMSIVPFRYDKKMLSTIRAFVSLLYTNIVQITNCITCSLLIWVYQPLRTQENCEVFFSPITDALPNNISSLKS